MAQHSQSIVQNTVKKTIHTKEGDQLCQLLRVTREKAGLTQQDLAVKLGRPQSFVAKYELGERRIDVIEFIAICNLLGANPLDMMKLLLK